MKRPVWPAPVLERMKGNHFAACCSTWCLRLAMPRKGLVALADRAINVSRAERKVAVSNRMWCPVRKLYVRTGRSGGKTAAWKFGIKFGRAVGYTPRRNPGRHGETGFDDGPSYGLQTGHPYSNFSIKSNWGGRKSAKTRDCIGNAADDF